MEKKKKAPQAEPENNVQEGWCSPEFPAGCVIEGEENITVTEQEPAEENKKPVTVNCKGKTSSKKD